MGGTAAALHAGHRVSFDVNSALADLRDRFPEVLRQLESLAGWTTARVTPPVLILGNFEGIDVGIRQLRRTAPLVVVPSLAEILRVKGWLVATRNAVRDYLDFAALADRAGSGAQAAMAPFDDLYPQAESGASPLQQLIKQLAEPRPYDFDPARDSLVGWRQLIQPWTDWEYVTEFLKTTAVRLLDVAASSSEP